MSPILKQANKLTFEKQLNVQLIGKETIENTAELYSKETAVTNNC